MGGGRVCVALAVRSTYRINDPPIHSHHSYIHSPNTYLTLHISRQSSYSECTDFDQMLSLAFGPVTLLMGYENR